MANFTRVLTQLRSERDRAQQELQRLDQAIATLQGPNSGGHRRIRSTGRKRSRFSAAARARMAAAQRSRRAKEKQTGSPHPRHMSAAARRKIAAAQRARWAKQKAQPKQAKNAA